MLNPPSSAPQTMNKRSRVTSPINLFNVDMEGQVSRDAYSVDRATNRQEAHRREDRRSPPRDGVNIPRHIPNNANNVDRATKRQEAHRRGDRRSPPRDGEDRDVTRHLSAAYNVDRATDRQEAHRREDRRSPPRDGADREISRHLSAAYNVDRTTHHYQEARRREDRRSPPRDDLSYTHLRSRVANMVALTAELTSRENMESIYRAELSYANQKCLLLAEELKGHRISTAIKENARNVTNSAIIQGFMPF